MVSANKVSGVARIQLTSGWRAHFDLWPAYIEILELKKSLSRAFYSRVH